MRALWPLLIGLVFVATSFERSSKQTLTASEQTGALVAGIALAGVCGWVGVRLLRPAVVRRASLRLDRDRLVVDHRGLFKNPVLIPHAQIRCAAIDARPAYWRWFRDHKRFHLGHASGDDSPTWLWSRTGDSPIPLLSHVGDVPNLAVLFTSPVELRTVRRWMKPFTLKGPVHIPRRGQKARGFLARVEDPEGAEADLQRWTVTRPLTVDDVADLQLGPDEKRKARTRRIRTNIALLMIVAVQAIPPFLVDGN